LREEPQPSKVNSTGSRGNRGRAGFGATMGPVGESPHDLQQQTGLSADPRATAAEHACFLEEEKNFPRWAFEGKPLPYPSKRVPVPAGRARGPKLRQIGSKRVLRVSFLSSLLPARAGRNRSRAVETQTKIVPPPGANFRFYRNPKWAAPEAGKAGRVGEAFSHQKTGRR